MVLHPTVESTGQEGALVYQTHPVKYLPAQQEEINSLHCIRLLSCSHSKLPHPTAGTAVLVLVTPVTAQ